MPSYSLINLSHFCQLPWARSIHNYTHDHACWEYEVTTHYETGWTFIYSGTIQSVKFLLYWFHTLGKEKQKEKCWHRWNEREGPGSSRVIIEIHGNANLPATVASSGTLYEGSYIINTGGTPWHIMAEFALCSPFCSTQDSHTLSSSAPLRGHHRPHEWTNERSGVRWKWMNEWAPWDQARNGKTRDGFRICQMINGLLASFMRMIHGG